MFIKPITELYDLKKLCSFLKRIFENRLGRKNVYKLMLK